MDPELKDFIIAGISILLGGGGLYGINRARGAINGNGQPAGAAQDPMTVTGTHAALTESVSPAFCQAQHSAVTSRLDRVDEALDKGGKKMDEIRDTLNDLTIDVRSLAPTTKADAREAAREEAAAEVAGHERRLHNGR